MPGPLSDQTPVTPNVLTQTEPPPSLPMGCRRIVFPNGMVLLVAENPVADIVSARIFVRAGSLWEPPAKAGLAHLLAAVLTKGAPGLSARTIAEQVESMGAGLSANATADYFLMSLKSVAADFSQLLTLAALLLRSPTFPETEVSLEQQLGLQALRSQHEQPFTVALEQLRQDLYGDHPYAQSSLGTQASLASLARQDLQQYHQTWFRPDNVVISMAGRLELDQAIALVEKVLGDWQRPSAPLPTLELPAPNYQPQQRFIVQDTQQSIVMLGYPAASIYSPDYIALKLLSTYLGNGLSSRLFVELREKRGLAYEVSAFYPARLEPAYFVIYLGTAPENTATALASLQAEMDRLRDHPLEAEALAATRNKILGQYALGKQTNAQIAQVLGWYEALKLGVEYDRQFQEQIAAISAETIYEVAHRHFSSPASSVVVGPADPAAPVE